MENLNQINSNILQIEDEYYSVIRPKSTKSEFLRMTENLYDTGVEFIEYRTLDLNPFSAAGVSKETLIFIKVFMFYCLWEDDENIDESEQEKIDINEDLISRFGRKRNLQLHYKNNLITRELWAKEILSKMLTLVEKIEDNERIIEIINDAISAVDYPELTLSGRLQGTQRDLEISFSDIFLNYAISYKEEYCQIPVSSNLHYKVFENEAKKSQIEFLELSDSSPTSFHEYLSKY